MKPSLGIVVITVLWIIAILIISPLGEFPLNDDWTYAKSVQHLHNTGEMKMDGWPAMTLVAQIAWGGLFCKIGGYSFLTLRISTLITGLIGLFAFYKLAYQLAKNKELALFATLLFGFNPFFLSLSFTFMTDVHFFTFSILASLFFLKNIQTDKWVYFGLGIFCSLIATLIRQPGILFPVAYAICYFYKNRTVKGFMTAGFPFLCALAALILHGIWLKSTQPTAGNVIGISQGLSLFRRFLEWKYICYIITSVFFYTGIFMLPLSILYAQNIKKSIQQYKFKLLFVLVPFGVFFAIGLATGLYPGGNILYNLGLGPKTLKDAWCGVNISPMLPKATWNALMQVFGCIGAIACLMLIFFQPTANEHQIAKNSFKERLLTYWSNAIKGIKTFFNKTSNNTAHPTDPEQAFVTQTRVYFGLVMLMYIALLIINLVFFDRHLILLMAFAMLILLPEKTEYGFWQQKLSVGTLLFIAWFSVSATHDYLAWNRARWLGLNELTEAQKISPARIDGGFEFNAWHQPGHSSYVERPTLNIKSWWWVADDEYLMTFGQVEGYDPVKANAYFKMLSFSTDTVYVLKRR